jgi:hypothetical protein
MSKQSRTKVETEPERGVGEKIATLKGGIEVYQQGAVIPEGTSFQDAKEVLDAALQMRAAFESQMREAIVRLESEPCPKNERAVRDRAIEHARSQLGEEVEA